MSIRHLKHLFAPASVAVIGASDKPQRIGTRVLANLVEGGFGGALWPLNPRHDRLHGLRCYAKLSALPAAPDLAILCTPPATIPGLIADLGARGTRAAIVMTAGLEAHRAGGRSVRQAMLEAARPHRLRILGPGSVGLQVPALGLNASFTHLPAAAGKLAFVSQSGALGTAVLDWASLRGIGFSTFVAMGEGVDVDFGDMLDYLAADNDTAAILLCVERVSCARKFMSAGRLAARGKPVIVLKVGRDPEPEAELAFDAAIRRAGMLRVYSTEDLFDAVETLARARQQRGERLAVLTNGGGLGLIAADALQAGGATLAGLSPETLERLRQLQAPQSNPLDLLADAPVERYSGAVDALLHEPQADALLFLHAPTAMVSSALIAEALAPQLRAASRNVLSCWLGGRSVAAARQTFSDAGLPTYDTPEKAVHGFLQIVQYRRNQDLLMEVPARVPAAAAPQRAAAQALVTAALAAGHSALDARDTCALLAAYGIPMAATEFAADAEQALAAARRIGYPVALKAGAHDIGRKADVGGVVLDLEDDAMLHAAACAMRERVRRLRPAAGPGFAVQQMARRPQAQELAVRVRADPVFGPVILFGQGGPAAEVADDRVAGLPPLNMVLARDMVGRTRVARLLAGYGDHAPADADAIGRMLVQVAEMVADLPELTELEINPLLADADGVLALDADIRLAPPRATGTMAIRPYPQELEQELAWQGRTIVLRPIRPEDAPQHLAFFRALAPDDVRLRFFSAMRELPPSQLARLTQIDYDRAMAFIATGSGADGQPETLGVVRAVVDSDNQSAEFAIIVRSDLKGLGLGRVLFQKLVDYFRSRGTAELSGEALSENNGVQSLVRHFGGTVLPHAEAGMVNLRLPLQAVA
ncbi:bifunctional acetate--CoA ligase family protein/GNAT family N-acetyltransferase [Rugamonas apoptosis]|uniref:Acetate--CoA ligase family protein n=1 Tax=Rugamonas apoptosis TaxID=2758570 RepID=A0A7W2F8Q9_9BURK|nr:acetate--CoA ligase family protein [Rugamonas apoptosis]MBA5687170.1 acetate--CoA ligase family protein [Rugamonas apoptosis]